jgi:hypothetical protein
MKNLIKRAHFALYILLTTFRKIIIIPIAFIHIAFSALLCFPIICLFFGLTKANRFMDNIVINYMELFS